jgi:hypothetical protein
MLRELNMENDNRVLIELDGDKIIIKKLEQ